MFPMGLADAGGGDCGFRGVSLKALAGVYGAASARLRPGGVGFAPKERLSPGGWGVEYPANHLVLMAKRRGEGIP
jgi:hypothetical protein